MKLPARIAALGLALMMALAGAGCSSEDTSWVAQVGEDTLPAGVYLVELMMGYNDAASQLSGEEDILKGSIGDVPAPQYITDFAKLESAKLLAIRRQFQDRGLSLSEEDESQATQYTDYLYSIGEDFYTANGVAKESVYYINETSMMSLNVFNDIYQEGGEKGISRDELKQALAQQYTRSQYILFPKVDMLTGAALDEAAIEEARAEAESYLARAQAGEHFPDLIYEQSVEQNGEAAGEQMEDDSYDIYLENNAGFYPSVFDGGGRLLLLRHPQAPHPGGPGRRPGDVPGCGAPEHEVRRIHGNGGCVGLRAGHRLQQRRPGRLHPLQAEDDPGADRFLQQQFQQLLRKQFLRKQRGEQQRFLR